MDVVFHRNCLDGAYSAYLMYLLNRSMTLDLYESFIHHLENSDSHELVPMRTQQVTLKQFDSLTEDFFHQKSQIPFRCVSMHAGSLYPIFPSTQGNILLMVDISPTNLQQMTMFAQRFRFVVMFDHHTSFDKSRKIVEQQNFKNVFYVWNQNICATQIVFNFFFESWGFPKNYPGIYQPLRQQIKYVANNDLKKNETKVSKQFVLGFYYFEIQMSHHNPLLFKRLWNLSLESILSKGENRYKLHIDCLIKQVERSSICLIKTGKFKGTRFLASQSSDRGLVSDLGCLLSFLSVRNNMGNLAMIFGKGAQYRVSFRSSQSQPQPLALQIAESLGGGGHVCAAGCGLSKNNFNQTFKMESSPKIAITQKQIQFILFNSIY